MAGSPNTTSSTCACLQADTNGTNGAQNINALLNARPDAVNPIIGYNILPKGYTLANLKAGQTLDTTDTAKSGNSVNGAPQTLQVTVASNSGSTAQVPCNIPYLPAPVMHGTV